MGVCVAATSAPSRATVAAAEARTRTRRREVRTLDADIAVGRRTPTHLLWRAGLLAIDDGRVGQGRAVAFDRGHRGRTGHARAGIAGPGRGRADVAAAHRFLGGR